jgi:hypothetical protein
MSKKINSFWRLLLGSLIALLGFGSCKTTKKVQTDDRVVLYGPPPVKVEKQPIDRVVALYATRPVRLEKESE